MKLISSSDLRNLSFPTAWVRTGAKVSNMNLNRILVLSLGAIPSQDVSWSARGDVRGLRERRVDNALGGSYPQTDSIEINPVDGCYVTQPHVTFAPQPTTSCQSFYS